jgi:hypothetical protein
MNVQIKNKMIENIRIKNVNNGKEKPVIKVWNGRVTKKISEGYVLIKVGIQWIPEHRLVTEEAIGRQLTHQEVIHHKDFNKRNNSPSNLVLFKTQKEHAHWHRQFNQFGLTRPLIRIIEEKSILNISLLNNCNTHLNNSIVNN